MFNRFALLFLLTSLSLWSCTQSESEETAETEETEEVANPVEAEKIPEKPMDAVTEVGDRECARLHGFGRYTYINFWDESAYITIDETTLTEHYSEEHFYLKANLKWTSDCTYEATIETLTIPYSTMEVGDIMKVEILQTRGDTVFFKSTYGEDTNYVAMIRGAGALRE